MTPRLKSIKNIFMRVIISQRYKNLSSAKVKNER
nr:MAG TPA: hypothetical protein [Caudoviricetes sp.]